MPRTVAFFSYTRADDNASAGILSKARALLEKRVHVKYGHKINIFQDTDDIKYGDNWKRRLDAALDEANYLLPIITPLFFNSEPCREELSRFLEKSKSLGRDDLVVPILFLDTPALGNVERLSKDALIGAINQSQWADWRAHEDKIAIDQNFHSDINRLAQRIVDKVIEDESNEEAREKTRADVRSRTTYSFGQTKKKLVTIPAHRVIAKDKKAINSSDFSVNEKVFHQKFGFGIIKEIVEDRILVMFGEGIGLKKVVASYIVKAVDAPI